MQYLLDTNTCIAVMRKDAAILRRMSALSPGDCAISTVTSYELYTGVEKCSNPIREAAKVATLLQTVHTLPFDSSPPKKRPTCEQTWRPEDVPSALTTSSWLAMRYSGQPHHGHCKYR